MNLTLPQVRSLAAGFTSMLIYGSGYTYGTLIPFATSYLYHSGDHDITAKSMALLLPISIIVINAGMPLCNIPQLQFSNRVTTFISIIGLCSSVLLLSFGQSFWVYVVLYGIFFGLFIGFGYMAPIKNCIKHIPDKKGLCSGVCILGLGISSFLFNMILVALINPSNQQPFLLPDGSGRKIYSFEVSNNLPFALRIMSAVYLGIGLIGIALISPESESESFQKNQPLKQSILSEQGILPSPEGSIQAKSLKAYFTFLVNKKILWQVLTLTTSIPFGMFIAFNYKEYGRISIKDDYFMTVIGSCGAIFNGVGRFVWGFANDRLSFRTISIIINIMSLICALSIPYLLDYEYLFLVVVSIIYFNYGGSYSIYPTLTMRIFGPQVGGRVYGIVFIGFSLGCVIQWGFRQLLVPQNNQFEGFKTCFYIFAALNLVSLLLTSFIKYDILQQKPSAVKNEIS